MRALLAIGVLGFSGMAFNACAEAPAPSPSREKVTPAIDVEDGSSVGAPTSPHDAQSARERAEDERRATESKRKMKKRPGYKEEVPAPRV
jgi:hypothetical protein